MSLYFFFGGERGVDLHLGGGGGARGWHRNEVCTIKSQMAGANGGGWGWGGMV